MLKRPLLIIIISLLLLSVPLMMEGRKKGYRLPSKETSEEKRTKTEVGTFRVKITDDTLTQYSRRNIIFSGYEKKLQSSRESFFITNRTDHTIKGIELSIEYLTVDGRQLNRRYQQIPCDIPPGETRPIEIKSWDSQHAFFFHLSPPTSAAGMPFIVKMTPMEAILKY